MKSIISKAQHPHVNKFDKICLKCTPDGYNEDFSLQCNGLFCKIHHNEEIVFVCKFCKKQFNSYSYLFHNTSKNVCPKYQFLTKSKKSKIKKSKLFGQRFSINSILKSYYEDPTFPKDECINQFFRKIRESEKDNSNLRNLIDEYFETQDNLSHNKNIDDDKPLDTESINKLSEKYSTYVNKLSDILSKTQRYNTRSRHTDINTEICNSLSKSDKNNIEKTMNRLIEILDKENMRYQERTNEMKEYYNQLIQLTQPIM
eukprot:jgi/Orpsp1_1/1188293/evm.model.d7180000063671.1